MIDVNNSEYYFDERYNHEFVKARLEQLNKLWLQEFVNWQFWIKWLISWVYIEKVRSYTESSWSEYISWIKSIVLNNYKK